MALLEELRDLRLDTEGTPSSDSVEIGVPIPKVQRLKIISADDWEMIVEQWASTLKEKYSHIQRMGGSGDKGIDVVGFYYKYDFQSEWENYQCKHYKNPLTPSDVTVEIGKIIYYSFKNEYKPPQAYFFVAPLDIGTALSNLIGNPQQLKADVKKHWDNRCKTIITKTEEIKLEGNLLTYFESFDFSIFDSISPRELLEGHAKTPFHSTYFGGGLPARGVVKPPPSELHESEFRYISQMIEAYSDFEEEEISNFEGLSDDLKEDFNRQRERYYHTESLRNFARDNVPEGTFDNLKDEIYQGVIDKCNSNHANGLIRMRETLNHSSILGLTASPLIKVLKQQDRMGMCHHLSNEDKLKWVKKQ